MTHTTNWGYGPENGPSKWDEMYPEISALQKQSPVDLSVAALIQTKTRLNLKYEADCCQTITNNGHSLQVSGIPQDSYVTGGPLEDDKYRFAQFHVHWGPDDSCGSEHTIDGQPYSAEIHIVNWNSTKYSDVTEAMKDTEHCGICVLGVLVEADDSFAETEFEELTNNSMRVSLPNSKVLLRNTINIQKLLPGDCNDFYFYDGSLTTPPCTQCVKWIVFGQPIYTNSNAIRNLRKLKSGDGSGTLLMNFRPPQPLNDRMLWRQMGLDVNGQHSSNSSSGSSSSD